MSLRHSAITIRRRQRQAFAALVVLAGAVWIGLIRPVTSHLAQTHTQLQGERAALAESTLQTNRLPQLEAEVERLTGKVGRFKSPSPASQLEAAFRDISSLAEQSPVTGYRFVPREGRRYEFGPEQVVELKFESSFVDAWDLIHAVESLDRLTRIREMTIRTARDPQRVEVTVLLSLFFTS
jgi:Tfp pilus assembly protein PilO